MNKSFVYGSVTAMLLLSGCAIGPDYSKPLQTVPENFEHASSSASSSVQKEWWKEFNDPKMDRYIREALQHNYDLQASKASVEMLLGQFEQVRSAIFPQINASGSLNHKTVDNAASSFMLREGVTSTYAASLSLASYELDLFGKVRRANEAARAKLLSSEFTKDALALSISAATAASYLKLASLNEQIALAQENISLSEEILKLNRLRYQYGTVSQTIVLQSESEWHNAKATLMGLESSKISEQAVLNILLGHNPDATATTPIEAISLPEVPSALPSELLKRRPDIASAEHTLIAANAQIGIAEASYYPSIKLTGLLGIQSLELSNFTSNPSRIFELTPSVSIPIFTAGRIEGEINIAKAEYSKTLAEYQKSIISALNDTDSALGTMSFTNRQLEFQNNRSQTIEEAFKQAQLQYKTGTIDYSKLLQTQQQWLAARQTQIISKQNALTAAVNLRKSLGGGWEKESVKELP